MSLGLGTPDTADIVDIFSVDVTPLASISTFGIDVTTCPDLSGAASMSVDPDAYYTSAADTGAYLKFDPKSFTGAQRHALFPL